MVPVKGAAGRLARCASRTGSAASTPARPPRPSFSAGRRRSCATRRSPASARGFSALTSRLRLPPVPRRRGSAGRAERRAGRFRALRLRHRGRAGRRGAVRPRPRRRAEGAASAPGGGRPGRLGLRGPVHPHLRGAGEEERVRAGVASRLPRGGAGPSEPGRCPPLAAGRVGAPRHPSAGRAPDASCSRGWVLTCRNCRGSWKRSRSAFPPGRPWGRRRSATWFAGARSAAAGSSVPPPSRDGPRRRCASGRRSRPRRRCCAPNGCSSDRRAWRSRRPHRRKSLACANSCSARHDLESPSKEDWCRDGRTLRRSSSRCSPPTRRCPGLARRCDRRRDGGATDVQRNRDDRRHVRRRCTAEPRPRPGRFLGRLVHAMPGLALR